MADTFVVQTAPRRSSWLRGAAITALGLLAAVVCYLAFPDVVVNHGGWDSSATVRHGLRLWVLALMCASVGVWELLECAWPALWAWRIERGGFARFLVAVVMIAAVWLGWR